jgi:hypothetical protein
MPQAPNSLQVQQNPDGKWQVLIAADYWLTCASESDAKLLAHGPIDEHDFIYEIRNDLDFANELEQLADLFKKYKMGVGEGWFRVSSNQIRAKHEPLVKH